MTTATLDRPTLDLPALDLPTWADDQLDSQPPLQRLADAVASLWSAGTGLALQPAAVALDDTHATVVLAEPSLPGGWEEPAEALSCRLDRPFGRRARDLAGVLQASVRELLGRPLTRVRARDRRGQGRVVIELSLAPA
jgi:hypothetical protein